MFGLKYTAEALILKEIGLELFRLLFTRNFVGVDVVNYLGLAETSAMVERK